LFAATFDSLEKGLQIYKRIKYSEKFFDIFFHPNEKFYEIN